MKKDFFYKYGFHIVFVVVFLLSFVWMGTKATIQSNSNSVEDWLPNQYQQTQDYKWFLRYFPFESFIVVSWDGCTLEDDKIELFAQKLVPEQTINNFSLATNRVPLKAELDIQKVSNRIRQDVLSERRNDDHSAEEKSDQEDLQFIQGENTNYFKSVMTGPRLVRLLKDLYTKTPQMNMSTEELDNEISERLKGTLIGPDGKSTAMIITLASGPRGGKYLKKVIDRVHELAVESGLPNTSEIKTGSVASRIAHSIGDLFNEITKGRQVRMDGLILGGPPTDNVALDQEGERTLFRLAGLCALIGGTLAFLCLRSIRLTMFVFWISVLAAGVALAMVSLTGGTCDSILLSMPALVYVLAMSGSIHLVNYYHDAIREQGLPGAPERALEHAFAPCFFAQLTTAIGLGSLFVSNLIPITKFGFYSAIGVMTTLLLLFLYLPALLYFYPSKEFDRLHGRKGLETEHGIFSKFWGVFGKIIIDNHNLVAVLSLCVMLFFAWNIPKAKTSVKMMDFFSSDAEIIKHYGWLEEKLGPLVPMELVVSFDNSKLNRNTFGTTNRLSLINDISEALKEQLPEEVGGTLSVGMFAPDIDALWDSNSIAYRTASPVIGKSIDENRGSLRDYLTIEGNPSLDEIADCLRTRWEALNTEFQQYKISLENLMKDNGFSLDAELIRISQPRTAEKSSISESVTPNPFQADLEKLLEEQQKAEAAQTLLSFFEEKKSMLLAEGVQDLEHLLAISQDRPWKELEVEQIARLKETATIWLQEQGIELWRITVRVWSLKKDIDYSKFIDDVKGVVEPILAAKSNDIIAKKTKTEDQRKSQLEKDKRETAKASGMPDDSSETVDKTMGESHCYDVIHSAGISAKYTGMVPLVYKTQHELIKGLVESLMMAFVLICFVLMFVLRSIPGGLIAMIPNLFPVTCVFGFMAWRGILIDVGTMMTASVALGVAVDDTMHYLTWFSDGVNKGNSAKEAALNAYRRCAAAMTQSTVICGFGLSAFAFSTFVPTQKFGMLMLAILVVALIGDLIFLPALLTGPLGRFFVNMRRKKAGISDRPLTSSTKDND